MIDQTGYGKSGEQMKVAQYEVLGYFRWSLRD